MKHLIEISCEYCGIVLNPGDIEKYFLMLMYQM